MVRCAASRLLVSKMEAGIEALSSGQAARVSVKAVRDCWSYATGDVRGGSRSRGSEMLKDKSAPFGSDAASVTEAKAGQRDSGASGPASGEDTGARIEQRAYVAAGPVISIEPISKRRSRTVTAGFCTLAILTT